MNKTCAICGKSDSQGPSQAKDFFANGNMLRTQTTSIAVNACSNKQLIDCETLPSGGSDFNVHSLKQELAALTGCVSRCRTVFSPEPSTALLSETEEDGHLADVGLYNGKLSQHSLEDNDHCDCFDYQSSDNNTGHQLVRQHSSEYDHLDDFSSAWNEDGHLLEDKTCAVSVHFRTDLPLGHIESERLGDGIKVVPCIQSASFSSRQQRCGEQTSLGKYSDTAESCSMHFTDQYSCHHSDLAMSASVESPHLSTWPRNHKRNICCTKVKTCIESMPLALNFISTDVSRSTLKVSFHTHASSNSIKSLHSLCCEKSSSPYIKGIDGIAFKTRMETLLTWFEEFSDQQRNSLLGKILEKCNCSQMHHLSTYMEPILHNGCPHNCQDPLSWFPPSVSYRILLFLDPVSLCQASRVSKAWNAIANDANLWMIHCRNLLLSAAGESKQRNLYVDPDGTVQWKEMYSERFRLRRNWLKGYCTVRTFEGHTQGISCVQFDETRIVSGSWDKTIKVWNRRTNTAWAALTLSGHSGTVQCLHLHKNRLVSGSSDRTIKVWDLSTDKVGWVGAACRATMVGHLHTVRCLQADDDRVISGSYDHTLKIWDIRSGHCNATLRGHTDAVLCLQFDGQRVVSGSKDTSIKVWNLPDGNCKLTLYGHQAAVTCLQFDERRIISGALDRLIKIWNICTGEREVLQIHVLSGDMMSHLAQFYNACIQTLDWIRSEGHTGVVRHLQADRWKIVSAADDKTMKVWSLDTGARLLTLRSHTDGVTCLQFNDEVIVSGSYDKTVKLWDFSVC